MQKICDRGVRRRVRPAVCLAVAPVAALAVGAASDSATASPPNDQITFSQLGNVVTRPVVHTSGTVSVNALNAPPISGFIPQVVFGLSPDESGDDFDWYSHPSAPAVGTAMPSVGSPKYFVATYDTGAQSHILTVATADALNITGNGLDGAYEQTLIGANGFEYGVATDALGVYAAGFQNVTSTTGGNISVAAGSLKGHYNSSVIVLEDENSALPNIIGTPMTALYQTQIKNSQTQHLRVGSSVYKSPQVSFQPQGSAVGAGYSRLTLSAVPQGNYTDPPSFLPNFDTFDHNDPQTATFWGSLLANVTVSHTGGSSATQFLFDTGAEVSVLSEDTANSLGIFLQGPSATPPDFYVDIAGVGGTTLQKPGYYIQQLKFTTTTGFFTYTNVPVVIVDLPDPRDPLHQTLPGVLGMNLFNDRDMIIDTSGTPYAYFSTTPYAPQWNVATGGNWSDDAKWMLGSPQEAGAPANFLGAISAPQTITVDMPGFKVGSMKFDNANRYTIAGTNAITLEPELVGSATIDVVSGSHTIAVPLVLNAPTVLNVTPSSSTLTMSGDFSGGTFAVTKTGAGTVEMKHARAGTLSINTGTVTILANGTSTGTSKLGGALTIAGGATPTATLDLKDNDLVVGSGTSKATIESQVKFARNGGAWNQPGITSSTARANANHTTGLGVLSGAEYSSIGGGTGTFSGQTYTPTDTLVKYTWNGDANFSGTVSFDDYVRIDTGFNQHLTGWANGDFNYSGTVNFDDYVLIDTAFNAQNGTLGRAINWISGDDRSESGRTDFGELSRAAIGVQTVIEHFEQFGAAYGAAFLAAVPEPGSFALASCVVAVLARRKRRTTV